MKELPNKDVPIPVRLESDDSKLLEQIRDQTGISASALIRASVRLFLAYVRETGTIPLDFEKTISKGAVVATKQYVVKKGAVVERDDTADRTAKDLARKTADKIETEKDE